MPFSEFNRAPRRGRTASGWAGAGSWPTSPASLTTPGLGSAYCLAAFLIGLFHTTTIQLIGAMPIGEFVLLFVGVHAALGIASMRRLPAPVPAIRLLLLFAVSQAVALASYVITDVWRESAGVDMLRGWLRMIFVLIDLGAVALILGATERAFIWLQIGTGLCFVQVLIAPPLFNDYWKFGFAYPTTVLVLLLAPRRFGFWGAVLGSVGMGVLHISMDYRSLGATCLAVGALIILRVLPKMVRQSILTLGLLACIAASPMIFEKMFAMTGTARANRSNVQRSAMLQAAWEGFISSPLIGQGSWFSRSQVLYNYLQIRADKEKAAGLSTDANDGDVKSIAIHSQILVSLAEGGIFGATFFFVYGFFLMWALWFALTEAVWHWTVPCRILLLLGSSLSLWMAPFSGPARIDIAVAATVAALFWRERPRQRTRVWNSRPRPWTPIRPMVAASSAVTSYSK